MPHFIFIDFTGEKSVLGLGNGEKDYFTSGSERNGISLIHKLLKKVKQKSKGIIVVIGPGSFSAVRGGVLAANMMAELLQIKVVGLIKGDNETSFEVFRRGVLLFKKGKAQRSISPFYYAPPNITMPTTISK